jgi:hypothetical protein
MATTMRTRVGQRLRCRCGVSSEVTHAILLAAAFVACSGGSDDDAGPDMNGIGGTSAEAGAAGAAGVGAGGTAGTAGAGPGSAGSGGTSAGPITPIEPAPSLDDLAEDPAEVAPWTILVYGHADHNLSNTLFADMLEMAAAQLDGVVQLVVLADWDSSRVIGGSEPPVLFPEGLQLYRIAGGGLEPELIAQAAEANLDNPLEVAEIVRAVFSALPSERRGLVLWDHGGSWFGGFGGDGQDRTALSVSPMSPEVVADAVQSGIVAAGITESRPFDFIAFDTCLMAGAEVAFPFVDLTDTYIAAAEIDYGAGWNYEATLTHFAANPSAPMTDLAVAEVAHWDTHHASNGLNDALLRSHAALDLTKMGAFAAATEGLAAVLDASESFDFTELARSAFLSVSPYSSELGGGTTEPGLRDAGQVLDALSLSVSDPAVAQAAQTARDALDQMVLASSQGSLRSGTQMGVHIEQTLGSNFTQERLLAYRGRASQWVGASRWDRVLELASAAADDTPPLFGHLVSNAEAASRAAPPVLQFTTEDLTAAKAAVYVGAETASNTLVSLGLIGAGLIEPGTMNEFAWDGTTIGFADGQIGMLDLWLDVPAGAQPVLSIAGLIGDATGDEVYWAYLIFGAGDSVASWVVVVTGNQPMTMSTYEIAQSLPGATFTPIYWEYGEAPEPTVITGNPVSLLPDGLPLFSMYVNPGDYFIITSVGDIWGNEGSEFDAVTLTESLGP